MKGVCNRAGQTHHDDPGPCFRGAVHELLDDHGGTVVEVRGAGEIEDDDLVVLDVRADHLDQLVRGRDGEGPPQRHQADARRMRIHVSRVFAFGQECPVQ